MRRAAARKTSPAARSRRAPRWLTWKAVALFAVLAFTIGIAGWHTHSHSHGALRVTAADGTSLDIGEWRLGSGNGGELPSLPAGELRFELTNADTVAHNFVLVRTREAASDLPVDNDGQVDLAAAGEVAGEVQAFAPGTSGGRRFNLKPGKYVLLCNIAGHYAGGMYYSLTVN